MRKIRSKNSPEMMSFRALIAKLSVIFKSSDRPEVQTHRNGPKPKEKISL